MSTRTSPRDEGFGLMEAVVASVLLGITAVVVATMLVGTLRTTTNSGRRSIAAQLAAAELEATRQLSATDIPDGRTTLPARSAGGTTFTIVREASYLTTSGSPSACAGTGKLAYKKIAVSVTWPDMGSTTPVRSETLRALGFDATSGGLDASTGSLAVSVIDGAGNPVDSATVTVTNQSAVTLDTELTGTDGCAVFAGLPSSTNVYASAYKAGSVNITGIPLATDSGSGIAASSLSKTTLQLSPPGSLLVNQVLPPGAVLPAIPGPKTFQVTLYSSVWPTPSMRQPGPCVTTTGVCVSTDGRTVTNLMPAAYTAWIGQCLDAQVTSGSATIANGSQASVNAPLGAVRLTSTSTSLLPVTVYARHVAEAVVNGIGCGGNPETITLGSVPARGGTLTVALPKGNWIVTTLLNLPGWTVSISPSSVQTLTVY